MIMKKYEITRDQIIELALRSDKASIWLQQNFKDAFKNALEIGKWYKSQIGTLAFYSGEEKMYGISNCGNWNDSIITKTAIEGCCSGVWIIADESEVSEALRKEAIKQGFGANIYIKDCGNTKDGVYYYHDKFNYLYCGSYAIFLNGRWAEIMPSITKSEAEKQLGIKIID